MREPIDRQISTPDRCRSCESLLLGASVDAAGFITCLSCQDRHPATHRAFLAVARETLAAADA